MQKECVTCNSCGAEIKLHPEMKECPSCHVDIDKCVVDKDATSSVYPM